MAAAAAAAEYYCMNIGQIPAFGDWDNVNQLPITQYFECARQAGLLRCNCSRECGGSGRAASASGVPRKKSRGMATSRVKEPLKQVKVSDLKADLPRHHGQPLPPKHCPSRQSNKLGEFNLHQHQSSHDAIKPVDEDLYKIPSELLRNSKRKKMLGFFSRCMVPPCVA